MLREKAKKYRTAKRRKYHVRRKVVGTPDRPRLSVYRSNRHIYAQIIDDTAAVTLASASTMSRELRDKIENPGNKEAAEKVGEAIAKNAQQVGINAVCFDRGANRYQGRARSLAESARKAGLAF